MKKLLSLCFALAFCFVCVFAASAAGMGDVADGDDEVTVSDARAILRAAVGLEDFPPETVGLADMDLDGEISVGDARLALRVAVGLEVPGDTVCDNQLALLAGKHYYADFTVRDPSGGVNVILAKTESSVYFESLIGSVRMTMLGNDEGLYFIDRNTKTYGELTEEIREMMSELGGEEFSAETLTGELPDLGAGLSLSEAEKTPSEFDGAPCDCYTVAGPDGNSRVYMTGPRLLAIVTEDAAGDVISEIVFNKVQPSVPADCVRLGSGYEAMDFLEFLLVNYGDMLEGAL